MLTRAIIVPNHPDKDRCVTLREANDMLNNNVWHLTSFKGHAQVMVGDNNNKNDQIQVLVEWADSWWNVHDQAVNAIMEQVVRTHAPHKLSDTTGFLLYITCFDGV